MGVCQTCGHKGYANLLIYCVHCLMVAVHRYCVDGPPKMEEEEIIWSCEECIGNSKHATLPTRKSERINLIVDREALRRRARRSWKNNLSILEGEKPNHAKEMVNMDNIALDQNTKDDKNIGETRQGRRSRILELSTNGENRIGEQVPGIVEKKKKLNLHDRNDDQRQHKKLCGRKGPCATKETYRINRITTPSHYADENISEVDLVDHTLRSVEKHSRSVISECRTSHKKRRRLILGMEDSDEDSECLSTEEDKFVIANVNEVIETQIERDQNLRCEENSRSEISKCQVPMKKRRLILDMKDSDEGSECLSAEQHKFVTVNAKEVDQEIQVDHEHGLNSEDEHSRKAISECHAPKKRRRKLILDMEDSDEESDSHEKSECPSIEQYKFVIVNANEGNQEIRIDHDHGLKSDDGSCRSMISDCEKSECLFDEQHKFGTSNANDLVLVLGQQPQMKLNELVSPQLSITKLDMLEHGPTNEIWRGCCSITYRSENPLLFAMEARLSTTSHPIVIGAASVLPDLIKFETVAKHLAWPNSFEMSPPTSDSIGLYFFPTDERDEKLYDKVVEDMIDNHLVLTFKINNLELLVFSSRELPQEQWRFQRKYYMWGVFKLNSLRQNNLSYESKNGSYESKIGTRSVFE